MKKNQLDIEREHNRRQQESNMSNITKCGIMNLRKFLEELEDGNLTFETVCTLLNQCFESRL